MGDETAGDGAARPFRGLPVSAGTAAGMLRIIGDTAVDDASAAATPDEVTAAFAAVAAERSALAERLREAGRGHGSGHHRDRGADRGRSVALRARRRGDARRHRCRHRGAARPPRSRPRRWRSWTTPSWPSGRATSGRSPAPSSSGCAGCDAASCPDDGDFILVRREVSPADLIELAEAGLVGAVSVTGGASSHAAIVARGLGLPMIAGASPAVLDLSPGLAAVLDAAGELVVGARDDGGRRRAAADAERAAAPAASARRRARLGGAAADGGRAPGHRAVQCGLGGRDPAGAGRGRGRASGCCAPSSPTSRPPTGPRWRSTAISSGRSSSCWRTGPPRSGCSTSPATRSRRSWPGAGGAAAVRGRGNGAGGEASGRRAGAAAAGAELTLPAGAGLAALLTHPSALADQLRAMLETGRDTRLAVLIPMVSSLRRGQPGA